MAMSQLVARIRHAPGRRPHMPRLSHGGRLLLCMALVGGQANLAAARDFLWRVSGAGGSAYLVGSVHLLTKDFYPLSPALEKAFEESDLLVEEADLGEMLAPAVQSKMLARGMLPPNTSLALLLSSLEWQKAGFDGELGLDRHFYDQARAQQKPIQGLETPEYQISRLDGLAMDQQDRLLGETLKDLDHELANLTTLVQAWKNGDTAEVERIVLADVKQEPVMYERLLVERNRNWMPEIEKLLSRPRPAFVVVGAAHLVGTDGLIAQLSAKGYRVEQQ